MRFLTTISWNLHFGTIEFVPSLVDHEVVITATTHVIKLYHNCGFNVQWILTDCEFEDVCPALTTLNNIMLNTTATANEHVPEFEQFIYVIKEHMQGAVTTTTLPLLSIQCLTS